MGTLLTSFESRAEEFFQLNLRNDRMKRFRLRIGLIADLLTFFATTFFYIKLVSHTPKDALDAYILEIHKWIIFLFFLSHAIVILLIKCGIFKPSQEMVSAFYIEYNVIGNFFRCLREGGIYSVSYSAFLLFPFASFFIVSKRFGVFVAFQTVLVNIILFIFTLNRPPPVLNIYQVDWVFHFTFAVSVMCYLADRYEIERQQHLEQIENASKRALEVTEEKSLFVSTMSHELRTPIHAILASADLLKELCPERDQQVFISTIQSCGQSLSAMINNILDFGRLQSNQMVQENSEFDLFELIQETVETHETAAEKKGIGLLLRIDPSLKFEYQTIFGDKDRLRQVLANILSNAVKFTDFGLIELFVSAKLIYSNHLEIFFRISDTGCGMKPSFLRKLFQPFVQENNSISRQFDGSGIGLCVAQNFVKVMKGSGIRVSSTLGKGSIFEFEIPATFCPTVAPRINYTNLLKELQCFNIDIVAVLTRSFLSRMFLDQIKEWNFGCEMVDAMDIGYEAILNRLILGKIVVIDDDIRLLRFLVNNCMKVLPSRGKIIYISSICHFPLISGLTKGSNLLQIHTLSKPVGPKKLLEAFIMVQRHYKSNYDRRSSIASEEVKWITPPHVLVVEDNKVNQMLVKHFLTEKLGVVCEIAENGEEAISKWKRQRYHLIIMDIQMPKMDGLEATRAIRKIERESMSRTHTIIVAMTGLSSDDNRKRAFEAGCDFFLTKPVDFTSIKPQLMEWLKEKNV